MAVFTPIAAPINLRLTWTGTVVVVALYCLCTFVLGAMEIYTQSAFLATSHSIFIALNDLLTLPLFASSTTTKCSFSEEPH